MTSQFPPPGRQAAYFCTGALAGLSALPLELAWTKLIARAQTQAFPFLRSHAPAATYRAATRFWTFDITRSQLSPFQLPVWLTGGLSGAAGGFSEVLLQSALHRKVPSAQALGSQSLKLFFCFGSYTFLSTTLSETQPPKPFAWCWCLGAAAGAFGGGIIARLEGVRGRELWRNAVPKGALLVGTVIAVQVTSCAEVLKSMKWRPKLPSGETSCRSVGD